MIKSTGDHGSFNKKYFISKGEITMKKNKGFSMVELIIVIAIMAILAGALAPALIKYINKSRISTDIQTANTIATAVQTALANETGYDEAASVMGSGKWTPIATLYTTGSVFGQLVSDTVGGTAPSVKSKKCLAGTPYNGATFEVEIDGNNVSVRESVSQHMLYPTASKCLTDDENTCAP